MYYVLTQKMQGSKVKIGYRIRMQKAFSLPEAVQRYCEGKKTLKRAKTNGKTKATIHILNCELWLKCFCSLVCAVCDSQRIFFGHQTARVTLPERRQRVHA